jgi:hypothetical protein
MTSAAVKTFALGVVVLVVLGGVPYVTSFLLTKNPVFPFFNAYFQSPFYPVENFNPPAVFERGMTWDTLYRMTFNSGKYLESTPGASGFQWLMLVVPCTVAVCLARNMRAILVAVVALAAWWLTFNQTAYLRYVFPFVALALVVVAVGLSLLRNAGIWPWRAGALAAAVVIILNLLHFNSGTFYGKINLRVIADNRARDAYIESVVPVRTAVKLLNELNSRRSPVAFFSAPLTAGLYSDALYASWYNHRYATAVLAADGALDLGKIFAQYDVDYVVIDDSWESSKLRTLVAAVSAEVARVGSLSIRRLDDKYRFAEELLQQTEVQPGSVWHFTDGAAFMPDQGALVSVESPAYASVPVVPGRRYRYSAVAMCMDEPAEGRLQVNWTNERGVLLKPDIQVFTCTPDRLVHSFDFNAPSGAVQALIYASGHTQKKVIFSSVSFRN